MRTHTDEIDQYIRENLRYDPETGYLWWIKESEVKFGRRGLDKPVGSYSRGYLQFLLPMPEGKRNMIITIGDEIKDNFEETSKIITKPPVGEKEDVTPKAPTNPFDNALNEIQQKGKTLLQKELTIEQNKKVSENVLKIVG